MSKRTKQKTANKYAGRSCWLDGVSARIGGRLNDCATIMPLDMEYNTAKFSWEAVERIMKGDKHFRS